MEQETIKALVRTPQGVEFIDFIRKSVKELNSVKDIASTDPVEVAIEVKARALAIRKLEQLFVALITAAESVPGGGDNSEFAVTVD